MEWEGISVGMDKRRGASYAHTKAKDIRRGSVNRRDEIKDDGDEGA